MSEQDTGPIVGIDLGTTNSLIALVDQGKPRVLKGEAERATLPSVVSWTEEQLLIGDAARDHALDNPENTVYSIKRLMGRSLGDLSDAERESLPYQVVASERGLACVRVGERTVSPEEVSAIVLRELRERASRVLGTEVTRAVVTVPAYFDDAQRQATRLAGKLAGLDVLRIVNEPTAAALAYGLDRTRDGCVVVYDLGGGTFDVSVLEIREGIFRVRATAGDTQLGGDDFDRKLMARLLDQRARDTTPDAKLLQAVKRAAEEAKIQLTDVDQVTYEVRDERLGLDLTATVTRAEFEKAIEPDVTRTLECCRRAIDDAQLSKEEIRAVVLVGGSTRVPLVRAKVEEFFGKRPYTGIDPDQVVALGAGVQADILHGKSRELLLLDVIPLSLGIETYGGAVAKIIMRNSPIPTQAADTFTTHVDDQTALDIHVLQGERELVKDCRSLGRFHLGGLPPLPAGMVRVEVSFLVDENGVLNVSAVEKSTGTEAGIEVVPSYGLTDDEIARVVQESFQHARDDFSAHQRIDLRNECQTMIRATKKILGTGNHQLDDGAVAAIRDMVQEVEANLDQEDTKALKALYDRFVEATVPLAGEVMSEVAQKAIQGKTVEQVLNESQLAPAEGGDASGEDGLHCGDLGDGFHAAKPEGATPPEEHA